MDMTPDVRALEANEQLFFLHIYKTAGVSFIRLMDQLFVRDELCPMDWPFRQLFDELQVDEVLSARFIRGHFTYDQIVPLLRQPYRVISFLRHPVARFVSHYKHIRRIVLRGALHPSGHPKVLAREEIMQNRFADLVSGKVRTLEEFVEQPHLYHWISAKSLRALSADKNLAIARQRLQTMFFVGVTESFERSLELLTYQLQLPAPQLIHHFNQAPDRQQNGVAISSSLRKKIEDMESAEMELYEIARARFERHYAAMKKEKARKTYVAGLKALTTNRGAVAWFDFSRVPIGHGWKVARQDSRYGFLRCGVSDKKYQLHVFVPLNAERMLLRLVQISSNDDVKRLKIRINGQNVFPRIIFQRKQKRWTALLSIDLPSDKKIYDMQQYLQIDFWTPPVSGTKAKRFFCFQWIAFYAD